MQDVQGQVLGVTGRTTRNGKNIFDVAFSDGNKYTTFDQALAQKAQQLQGQTVTARVEISQNGEYTNFNLKDIATAGQLAPLAQPLAGGVLVGAAPTGTIPMQSGNGNGMSPEREKKIVQQSSFSSAATIVAGLFQGAGPEAAEEAAQVWVKLARTEFNIVMGVPDDPAGIAQAVNAEIPGAVLVGAEAPPTEAPTPTW